MQNSCNAHSALLTKGSLVPCSADPSRRCTVMFCDIQGFTAWASARNPSQVFTLLETIYGAFDAIASKRGVFKVETIGDCYVAVTGLPDPRKDHALAMARFARDCRDSMNELTRRLESTLGPETGDLKVTKWFLSQFFFRLRCCLIHFLFHAFEASSWPEQRSGDSRCSSRSAV
jgi:hypothetical protein